LLLGLHLKVVVDGRNEVLAGLRFNLFNLCLNTAAAVDDNLSVSRLSAEEFIVILFEPAFADNIAGTKALGLDLRIFELLRADLTEGLALVERYLKAHSLTSLYDDVLIPVLLSAEADHHLEELDRDHRAALHQGIRDVLEDLALRARSSVIREETAGEGAEAGSGDHRRHVLCLPVRATRDELAAMMMTHVLREKGCDSQELSAQETASELVEAVAQRSPDAVCISVVAPSAMVHARNLCMKLRTRFPDLPLVIGFWGNHLDKATLVSAFAQWPLVTVVESIDEASLVLAGTKSSETSDDVAPAHGSTRHVSDAPLRPIAAI